MGSSSWFSSSSSTLCCVELLLLAARREKHHQDPKDAKMAALSFGFFVCFVLAPSRPRLMSRDTCLFPNIFLLSPFSLSNVPLVSKECQALSFFFLSLASLGRLSHRRTLRDWAVSVCIHFPRRFKYLCYTAAAPSCVPLICSFSLLLFLLFIHVKFFKNQKLVEGEISF